jgi:hypothetical protein
MGLDSEGGVAAGPNSPPRPTPPDSARLERVLQVAIAVAAAVIAAGGVAWLWSGEWRWAVTALVVAFVVLFGGAVLNAKSPPRPG